MRELCSIVFLHCTNQMVNFLFHFEIMLFLFPLHFPINQMKKKVERKNRRTHTQTKIVCDITWNNVKSTNKNKTIRKTIIRYQKVQWQHPLNWRFTLLCTERSVWLFCYIFATATAILAYSFRSRGKILRKPNLKLHLIGTRQKLWHFKFSYIAYI